MEIYSILSHTIRFLFTEFPRSSFVQLLNVENIKICEDFNCNKRKVEEKYFVKKEK